MQEEHYRVSLTTFRASPTKLDMRLEWNTIFPNRKSKRLALKWTLKAKAAQTKAALWITTRTKQRESLL